MTDPTYSREVRLRVRPQGAPTVEDFVVERVELPQLGRGEVRVRNIWMSVDPYMRGRMLERDSYVPPFEIGAALQGGAIGTVVASHDLRFAPGDSVLSMMGWREAFNAPAEALQKVDADRLPGEAYLGVAGLPGLTAWIGVTEIADVKEGDVVFVSAASGAVGTVACQIAKLRGATVIGSAGGPEKCAYLREIGVDRVIDYKAVHDLTAALREAAPDGIDVYFENVGGAHLEAALEVARPFARFAICGMITQYDPTVPGPANIAATIRKRLTIRGYVVSDHFGRMPEFVAEMSGWIETGKVVWRQSVDEGIEAAPGAFLKLFSGENFGKMLVRLG